MDEDCVCTCGFDCEAFVDEEIGKSRLEPGEEFECPDCGKRLYLGLGDSAVEIAPDEYEVVEYFYTMEPFS